MQDYNLGPSVSIGAVGDKYDSTATYAVGDYCIYDDKLYKCNTAISTAEAWNASHWTDTTIAEVLQTIPSVVDNLTTDDATKVLSAKQGKNLKDQIPGVVNNLTSDSTTSALSAAQGKALNSNIATLSTTVRDKKNLQLVDIRNTTKSAAETSLKTSYGTDFALFAYVGSVTDLTDGWYIVIYKQNISSSVKWNKLNV